MGLAGNVYAFDLRFQGGALVGDLDEVQPSREAVEDDINIRWDNVSNSCPLLNDVAHVELPPGYEKLPRQSGIPLGSLGQGQTHFWDHTLRGHASAIILLLPWDWTLSRNVMPPISCNAAGPVRISAKNHTGRIAILFIVEPSSRNLRTTWQMAQFKSPLPPEIQWINGLPQSQRKPEHITVDQSPHGSPPVRVRNGADNGSGARVHRGHRFLWIAASLLLLIVAFLWLARRRLAPGIDKLPPSLKSEYVSPKPHNKSVAVVFVHGVFGSNDDSWTNKGESFPTLLANDPTFQANTDVFLYEYFTPYLSTAGSIVELADQLRGSLEDHRIFKDHKRVVFLSHSMGGLIVRQFVISNTDKIPQIAMFYFYASPTNGSELASLAHYFSGNPQLRGMVPVQDNDLLQSIQQRWVGLSSLLAIPSYCAYELLPTSGFSVVAGESATALCNRPHDPMTFDHIQIVKPTDRSDTRYTRFVSALQESVPDALGAESSAFKSSEHIVQDGHERVERPILQTATIRLIDVPVVTTSRQKPFSMQTDTMNTGMATAYDVVVRQSAASGFDWRFDWKDESKNQTEMLAAQTGSLSTTSTVPEFIWPKSREGLGEFRTYIYGAVTYEERTSNHPTKHSYSYCYSLYSIRSKDASKDTFNWGDNSRTSPADVISQFIECAKKPPVPR
jgi:triacylglycerol esterase/lipase EstA (alpha/beta hydrolase family)